MLEKRGDKIKGHYAATLRPEKGQILCTPRWWEISSAVQNVTGAAEEQNAAMEEVSAAADGLARMAGELEANVVKRY